MKNNTITKAQIAALFRAYHAAKVSADKAKTMNAEIKNIMRDMGVNRLEGGGFVASVTPITSKRFDETSFKRDYPELYEKYTYTSTAERLNFK